MKRMQSEYFIPMVTVPTFPALPSADSNKGNPVMSHDYDMKLRVYTRGKSSGLSCPVPVAWHSSGAKTKIT